MAAEKPPGERVRFGIGAKLGILASALVIFCVGFLAWWMTGWSNDALMRQELTALADECLLRGGELINAVQVLREDALQQAGRPPLQEYLRAPAARHAELQQHVRQDFAGLLRARKQRYLQVEYLPPPRGAAAADGVPALKERAGGVDVNSDRHLEYFPDLARAADNRVQLSAVRRTDDAKQAGQRVPVIRAAAPLFLREGQFAGALVVTLDFRPLAKNLRRSVRHLTYLTDDRGRFLVHPEPKREFAFEDDPKAPPIFDGLMPDLKPLYEPGASLLDGKTAGTGWSGAVRPRGFQYPDKPRPWEAGETYCLVDLEAADPESWRGQALLQGRLAERLDELCRGGVILAASEVDTLEVVTTLRGHDATELKRVARELADEFAPHLRANRPVECRTYAVHFYRLAYSPPGAASPRWLGLAQALSREEIGAGIKSQADALVWIKVGLIVLGVAAAFLLSRRLTRPLHRITEATRDLARGDFSQDVELPVKAADEIGVLARCFKDMVEQLRQRGRQLRDNEASLRAVLRTAAEGIFILDDVGTIQMVNQAAEHIFGYPAEELTGQNVKLLIPKEAQGLPAPGAPPPGDSRPPEEPGVSSIKLGRALNRTQEVTGRRRDGTHFALELSVSDVAAGDGRMYTGIVRDITERKKAEKEIRELNEHLRELNEQLDRRVQERTRQLQKTNDELAVARDQALEASRAKSNFLATMSHELRTPLNAIKGYSELLLEEAQERGLGELTPDLHKIIDAGDRLLALINDVLDLSKIEVNKVELVLETFDVKAMADAAARAVVPLMKKNNNAFAVRCDDGVGAMYADRARVRQVLLNLLNNAGKFTQNGRVVLEVGRETWGGRDAVAFRVKDTGIGISREQLGRLFRAFTQADDSTTRAYGGSGLGLVICRSFCQMMGGDITVESEPGKGSSFTAHLPLQVTDPQAQATGAGAGAADPGRGGDTVLVIDDDPAVRELMQRYLDRDGFLAVTAANGHEGLRLARQVRPVAITLDVLMPGLGGWDVLTALKADPATADIPVIMLTITDERSLGQSLGAAEYLNKPIDRDRLAGVLGKYRDNRRARAAR